MLETRRVVTIDKGTDDGIELGDVVVVQGGALAGKVTDVGPTFAKVTLISDGSLHGGGQAAGLGRDRATSWARPAACWSCATWTRPWRSASTRRCSPRASSSGGGIRSPYPPGLVVGSVVDVERDANDVVQTAFLAPAANLDSFELALVITDYDGGLPPVDEQAVPCGEGGTVPEGEVECFTPAPSVKATPRATPPRP